MTSVIDYKNWEKLAAHEEAEEKERQQREREERRMKNFMEQAAAKHEFEDKQRRDHEAHAHIDNQHDHVHNHAHNHAHSEHAASGASAAPYKPRCGCGYMSPDDIKALQNAPPVVEVPLEQKNAKKRAAIAAAKEHGAQLFKEGDVQQALAVFERGVLIINGTVGLSDAEADELTFSSSSFDFSSSLSFSTSFSASLFSFAFISRIVWTMNGMANDMRLKRHASSSATSARINS